AVWLADPNTALFGYLNTNTTYHDMRFSMTTDAGVTWSEFPATLPLPPTFYDDREYLWLDTNPASPYYCRLYLSEALFGPGSSVTVGTRWSTDQGVTWTSVNPWVDPYELARNENANQFASLAVEPDGTLVG